MTAIFKVVERWTTRVQRRMCLYCCHYRMWSQLL